MTQLHPIVVGFAAMTAGITLAIWAFYRLGHVNNYELAAPFKTMMLAVLFLIGGSLTAAGMDVLYPFFRQLVVEVTRRG